MNQNKTNPLRNVVFSWQVYLLGDLYALKAPSRRRYKKHPIRRKQWKTNAELAQIAELQASSGTTNRMFAKPILFDHPFDDHHPRGLFYEMGASRMKNVLSSGVKNTLAFAFMIPIFYFGWWV